MDSTETSVPQPDGENLDADAMRRAFVDTPPPDFFTNPATIDTILREAATATNGHSHASTDTDYDAMVREFSVPPPAGDATQEAGAAADTPHARSVAVFVDMLKGGDPAQVKSAHNSAARGDAAALEAEAQVDAEAEAQRETPAQFWRQRLFTVGEFIQRPPKQWHIDQVAGVQDFVLLYGASGEGKTHVALDLAFSAATGRTFADSFSCVAGRPLTVCYATGEGLGGLADRLRAVSSYYGTQAIPFYILSDIPQLYEGSFNTGAVGFMEAWQELATSGVVPEKLDILILDTLHNATAGADENSAKDAGVTQQTLRRLRDTLGCTIVLVHHAGKNGMSERGSSALRASMDTVVRSQKNLSGGYTLTCEKLKDGDAWPAKSYKLEDVEDTDSVRVAWQGDVKTSFSVRSTLDSRVIAFLVNNVGTQYTAHEIAQGLKEDNVRQVQNVLKELRSADAILSEKTKRMTSDGLTRDVYVYAADPAAIVSLETE